MVSIRAGRLRLRSARSIPGGVTREPIPLHSARPAIGFADERVRFCVTFDPDGLFSRDRCGSMVYLCANHRYTALRLPRDKICTVLGRWGTHRFCARKTLSVKPAFLRPANS